MTVSLREAKRLAAQMKRAERVERKVVSLRIPTEMVDRMQRSRKTSTEIVNEALVHYFESLKRDQQLIQVKYHREQMNALVERLERPLQPTSDAMYDRGLDEARRACVVYLRRILADEPIVAGEATSQEPAGLRDALRALVVVWQAPIGATFDEPEYDSGREAGRQGCADQLLDVLEATAVPEAQAE